MSVYVLLSVMESVRAVQVVQPATVRELLLVLMVLILVRLAVLRALVLVVRAALVVLLAAARVRLLVLREGVLVQLVVVKGLLALLSLREAQTPEHRGQLLGGELVQLKMDVLVVLEDVIISVKVIALVL